MPYFTTEQQVECFVRFHTFDGGSVKYEDGQSSEMKNGFRNAAFAAILYQMLVYFIPLSRIEHIFCVATI